MSYELRATSYGWCKEGQLKVEREYGERRRSECRGYGHGRSDTLGGSSGGFHFAARTCRSDATRRSDGLHGRVMVDEGTCSLVCGKENTF
jgi:hypothetical protein